MISLRRTIPVLCTFLMVLYFAGCHSSPNTTQTANAGASPGAERMMPMPAPTMRLPRGSPNGRLRRSQRGQRSKSGFWIA